MKSKIMKAALFATAALAAGALASPTMARTLRYTFGTASGGAYCDGVTLTTTNNISYGGTHTGSCENADPAGGYAVKISGIKYLDIATTFTADGDTDAWTFFLSPATASWWLYHTSAGVFTFVNSGKLLPGQPPARQGAKSSAHAGAKSYGSHMF